MKNQSFSSKNESGPVPECLNNIKFGDNRIIVDPGSHDDTVAKSRFFGNHDLETGGPVVALQKEGCQCRLRGSERKCNGSKRTVLR